MPSDFGPQVNLQMTAELPSRMEYCVLSLIFSESREYGRRNDLCQTVCQGTCSSLRSRPELSKANASLVQACDACHKKKIRCIFSEPACELCRKTGQTCKFTRIEKSLPKRPRRFVLKPFGHGSRQLTRPSGKYLAALEERMKTVEVLLQQSKEKNSSPEETSQSSEPIDEGVGEGALATIINRGPYNKQEHIKAASATFRFPPEEEACRLAQGYFASFNHTFPIFSHERFMQRMRCDYPPQKTDDFVWWATVLVVLTFAHRLRAMSAPALADAENSRACPYLGQLLDAAPKITYMKPSLEAAQVLLATAAILHGTAMPDHVPMLTSAAIRMLQCNNVHLEEGLESPEVAKRTERMHTFWVAYIMDKDIALQFRKPPVLHEQDIGRRPIAREILREGLVYSLDSYVEANLFVIAQGLATIQGQVWSLIYAGSTAKTRDALEAAQEVLNPRLAAWKDSLPFAFKQEDLVGKWPKHAIVNIVTLHFRYFHTLVELNKEPPMEPGNPLRGDCPLSKALPDWPHSTSVLAVEAARNALDLAALTPRGNFQNVW